MSFSLSGDETVCALALIGAALALAGVVFGVGVYALLLAVWR